MSEVEFMDIFGDNLRDSMEMFGYNQKQLAREARISQATLSKYLSKQIMPSIPALINLTFALDCEISDLIPIYEPVR